MNTFDASGNTALFYAAKQEEIEAVSQLLKAGADVDAVNEMGHTALMEAAEEGNNACLKELH